MKPPMIRAHALTLFLALATAPALRAQPKEVDFAALEAVVKKEMEDANVPGAVVVIVMGDRVVYAKGFGVASVEGTDPVTPDHLFRVGSTTKMFVGAALVKLAEDGKLKLDEPVGKIIDGLPAKIAALTPHQLLTHTAGLADGNAMFGLHDDSALGAGIKKWTDDRFFTAPGDVYSYSNPGYWLAGYAAERAANKPFADVVADEMFKPLGMKRTTFRPTIAMTYPLAQGHELRDGKPAVVRPTADNAGVWPSGSMFTSANDFGRFAIAFMNGGKLDGKQVLSGSLIETMAARHAAAPNSTAHYGYGLSARNSRGVDLIGHGGSRTGYGSNMLMAPKHKFAVIVMGNRSGAGFTKTTDKAVELALALEPAAKPKAAAKPTAEELEKLAGTYRNGANSLTLKWSDGKLVESGLAKDVSVEPLGGSRFRREGGTTFEVATGKDGKTTYLIASGRAYRKQEK
jgi:CubicO group peptidase (beta-lactamase class C family)